MTLAIAAAVAGTAAQTGQPVYRAGADLVVLQVAVTDGRHRHVGGLGVDDFAVFEEGAPQQIQMFATADAPLDVMLLIDTSSSMFGKLDAVKRAASDVVGTLRDGDRAGVVLFHTSATFAQPLSEDRAATVAAIRKATPFGSTAMYEAVYLALDALSRSRTDGSVRRQALVLLTDGADNSSHVTFEHMLGAARTGDVTIFAIIPGSVVSAANQPPLKPTWEDATLRFQMRQLAEDTGGRSFLMDDPAKVGDIYEQITSELRGQYWLAYAPTTIQPGFRRISVRVLNPPGLRARTRTGYVAGARVATRARQ
jgi:VWFA-related protein